MSRQRTVMYAALGVLLVVTGGCRCRQWVRHWHDQEVDPEVANKWFWSRECRPMEPAPQELPEPAALTECGPYIIAMTYPGPQVIRIEKNMPDEVQIDSHFDYTITVTNISDTPVDNVIVTETVGENFEFDSSEPSSEQEEDRLLWSLGWMDGGESRTIRLSGRATDTECIAQCATVTYDIPTCSFTRVISPQLSVTVAAPETVLICDNIPLTYTVSNVGTGEAENVVITGELPAGLETTDGQREVEIIIGSLPEGATQEYTVLARAQETGEYETSAEAGAAGDLQAESETTAVAVVQPDLELEYSGPTQQYLDRPVELTLNVANVGTGPAMNTVVEAELPAEASNIDASDQGRVDGARVVWDLQTIGPDESRELSVSYTIGREDTYTSTATASAYCAPTATDQVRTAFVGLPAILLELVDTVDPVEVGQEETYVVSVTNQGNSSDSNIQVRAELEASMEFVSGTGPTQVEEHNGEITFEPLQQLDPGETATWNIVIRAVEPADARFKVILNSDHLDRDVESEEATQFYTTQ